MADLSDETLMAYADGALSPRERADVEAALSRDPSLRARLVPFEVTREMPLEPAPRHLVDLVMTAPMGTRAASRAERESVGGSTFLGSLARLFEIRMPMWSGALMSAAALLAGVLVTPGLKAPGAMAPSDAATGLISLESGHLLSRGVLQYALETQSSGTVSQTTTVGGGAQVLVRLTYRNAQAQFCRQYEIALPEKGMLSGIGCRTGEGRWEVMTTTVANASAGPAASYVAADGPGADIVGNYVKRTKKGDVLGATEEQGVMRRGWRP